MSNSLLYSSKGFDPSGSDDNVPEETKPCCYCKAPVDTDGEACAACIEANKADDEWYRERKTTAVKSTRDHVTAALKDTSVEHGYE